MTQESVGAHKKKNGTYVASYVRSVNRSKSNPSKTTNWPPRKHKKPGVINDYDLIVDPNLSHKNLSGFTFEAVTVDSVNFEGADLSETTWNAKIFSWNNQKNSHTSIIWRNCNFNGANLTAMQNDKIIISFCTLQQTNFENVNFENLSFYGENDLTGATLNSTQFSTIKDKSKIVYEQNTFTQAAKQLKLDDKKFEFLVLSKVINVYDNLTQNLVTAEFNPSEHHVPDWEIKSVLRTLESNS